MKRYSSLGIVIVVWLMLGIAERQTTFAQPPLALHATQGEVAVWQQRSIKGPYLDDWQRIMQRAQDFRHHPQAALWPGNQENEVWVGAKVKKRQQGDNSHMSRQMGDGLRDAGFVFLITGDPAYRDAVREALLAQVALPGTDFSNTALWAPTDTSMGTRNVNIINWLRKLTYGYSYIRAALSQGDRETIDRWFLNAATFWDGNVHHWISQRFPQRYQDDYTLQQMDRWQREIKGSTHWQGYTVYGFNAVWFNKPAAANALVAAVGVLLDNATLKSHAKRFVKEWLMFAVARDGTVADQFRWKDNDRPSTGFAYAMSALGSVITAVDHLARAGDTELYDYETGLGYYGWEGGPKSLRLVVQRYAKLTLGERGLADGVFAYAGTDGNLSADRRIGPGATSILDTYLIPANLYYRDATVTKAYNRPLPTRPKHADYDPWGGDWGTYPGIRFMFGQLEGKIWPYPVPPPALSTADKKVPEVLLAQ